MKINIEYIDDENNVKDFDFEETARMIIAKVLEKHNFKYDADVSLSVVSEDEIRELNKEMRKLDKITDVLSFPNINFETEADFSVIDIDANYYDYFNPESDAVILGDIVICYKRAVEQAESYGHSVIRELSFLTAHSILHLIGYDHENDDERMRMESMQREVLDELNIKR